MKQIILTTIAAAFLFAGCETKKEESVIDSSKTENATDMHNARNSLDYLGTYKGILPCADCEGIEIIITLNQDETYNMKTKYLGKDEKTYDELGDYTWKEDGNTLILEGIDTEPVQYSVSENKLTRLDMNGEKIKGAFEKNYELVKESK